MRRRIRKEPGLSHRTGTCGILGEDRLWRAMSSVLAGTERPFSKPAARGPEVTTRQIRIHVNSSPLREALGCASRPRRFGGATVRTVHAMSLKVPLWLCWAACGPLFLETLHFSMETYSGAPRGCTLLGFAEMVRATAGSGTPRNARPARDMLRASSCSAATGKAVTAARVDYNVEPSGGPATVSVVVPTFRRPAEVLRLLMSLQAGVRLPEEVLIVDNAPDAPLELPSVYPFPVRVLHAGLGMNLAGARNRGAQVATSDVCVFVDDDNVFERGALAAMASAFSDPRVGFVGPTIFAAKSGRVWCAGVRRSHWTTRTTMLYMGKEEDDLPAMASWATDDMPDCFAIRREVLGLVGGFDERMFPFYYDEADLCERLRRQGVQLLVLRDAQVTHYGFVESRNPGAEAVAGLERGGGRRVRLMVRARVRYHRRYEEGVHRIVTLGFGVPVWIAVIALGVLGRERDPRVVARVFWAVGMGAYHGYVDRLDPPPPPWANAAYR